ncbi:MAG: relaxase/mobilization nuclease domain-containing protein, partial [Candidatus Competibacteraceae bacterium]|nr:relaxase/mobilization nuclease domain-containing protein [Candidatus Competibacteraceae bacterium]
MIVKKIRNPRKASSKAVRIHRLADYIDRPHMPCSAHPEKNPSNATAGPANAVPQQFARRTQEKCIYAGARGVFTTTRADQKLEMLGLAYQAVRSPDPISHYVLSWRAGEQPTPAQVEEAVQLFLDELGLATHQAFYGLHGDTDHRHLHLMINRVHPATRELRLPNKGGCVTWRLPIARLRGLNRPKVGSASSRDATGCGRMAKSGGNPRKNCQRAMISGDPRRFIQAPARLRLKETNPVEEGARGAVFEADLDVTAQSRLQAKADPALDPEKWYRRAVRISGAVRVEGRWVRVAGTVYDASRFSSPVNVSRDRGRRPRRPRARPGLQSPAPRDGATGFATPATGDAPAPEFAAGRFRFASAARWRGRDRPTDPRPCRVPARAWRFAGARAGRQGTPRQ